MVSVPRRNYGADLERELGFRCDVKYFKECEKWLGVVVITKLRPGGVMDQAGFRDRDIVVDAGGAPDFFNRLETARGGRPAEIEVAPWMDPPDVAHRPVRELILRVPPRTGEGDVRQEPVTSPGRLPRLSSFQRQRELKRELGFREGWEWLPHNGFWRGSPTVEDLQPGGVLAQAGFQNKDILLEGFSFCDRWEKARGKQPIPVRVSSWIETTPLQERPRRVLTVPVPARNGG
jgi:hypothetical protein